jgi:hypothetical protein
VKIQVFLVGTFSETIRVTQPKHTTDLLLTEKFLQHFIGSENTPVAEDQSSADLVSKD